MNHYEKLLFLQNDGNVIRYDTDIPGPYGDTVKLYHNKTHNSYVREWPASGSIRQQIQEPEALEIMKRATSKREYTGTYNPFYRKNVEISGSSIV